MASYPSEATIVALHNPKGCEHCENRGTKGRILVAEVLMMTSELKSIVGQPSSTEADILRIALSQDFKPMWEHAFEAIVAGKLSLLNAEDGLGPMPYVADPTPTVSPALPSGPGNAAT